MRKSLKVIPFPGISDAYIVISSYEDEVSKLKYNETRVKKCLSFFWGNADGGAEWESEQGPITVIHPCAEDFKESDWVKATPHWFYPFFKGNGFWSQLAVDHERLPQKFLAGDYEGIFDTLRAWAREE